MRNHEGMVFKPMPVTMVELRLHISETSHDISEEMVRTRAEKLMVMGEREKDLIKCSNMKLILRKLLKMATLL